VGEVEPACGILDVRASASALSSPLILSTLHSPTSITQSLTHLQIPAPSMHTPRHPVCPQACATRGGLPTRCHLPLDAAPQEMACPPVDAASLVLSRAASGGLPASRRCALVFSLASLHYALATPGARLEMACSRGCPPRSHTSTLTHVHAHITLTQDPRRLSHGFLRNGPLQMLHAAGWSTRREGPHGNVQSEGRPKPNDESTLMTRRLLPAWPVGAYSANPTPFSLPPSSSPQASDNPGGTCLG